MLSLYLNGLMDPMNMKPNYQYQYGTNKIIDGLMNPTKKPAKPLLKPLLNPLTIAIYSSGLMEIFPHLPSYKNGISS